MCEIFFFHSQRALNASGKCLFWILFHCNKKDSLALSNASGFVFLD